jgi:hypothetical protein
MALSGTSPSMEKDESIKQTNKKKRLVLAMVSRQTRFQLEPNSGYGVKRR